jgi:hypothetical protein
VFGGRSLMIAAIIAIICDDCVSCYDVTTSKSYWKGKVAAQRLRVRELKREAINLLE